MRASSPRSGRQLVLCAVLCGFSLPGAAYCQSVTDIEVKRGYGSTLLAHPQGLVKVQRGELRDFGGTFIANLAKNGVVASWSFSPNGRYLAVGIRYDSAGRKRDSGTIRGYLYLYNAATGALVRDYTRGNIGPVTDVGFSKDRKTLFYETDKYEEIGGK